MTRRTRVYVSGPISNGGQGVDLHRINQAVEVGHYLSSLGYAPLIPHLTVLWDMIHPEQYDTWLCMDHAWILAADVVLRIPGESKGADAEELWAKNAGIRIRTLPGLLPKSPGFTASDVMGAMFGIPSQQEEPNG